MAGFNLQQQSTKAVILLAMMSVAALCILSYFPFLNTLEHFVQDGFVKQRALNQDASEDIVVIDIDDTSINALAELIGKWPWPRSVHAELLEYLLAHKPKAVVFDILFSEPDIYRPDADQYFSEVIASSQHVYLAMTSQTSLNMQAAPLLMSYPAILALDKTSSARTDARAFFLLPNAVSKEAWRLGSIEFHPDSDGVGRRYPVVHDFDGWLLHSLPARVAKDLGYRLPDSAYLILDWKSELSIPHQRFSYAEILSQARAEGQMIPEAFFKDKIIVIGTTALGLHDLRATPINEFFPGVFILTTALDNLISGESLQYIDTVWALVIGILSMLLISFISIWRGLGVGILIAFCTAALLLAIAWRLALSGVLLAILANVISLVFFMVSAILFLYLSHRKKLNATVDIFSRFMDPMVVRELINQESSEDLLSSKSVEVTMLFSDIRNFTSISEQRTPGEMVNLLNHYLDRQVKTLFQYHATLDKFIGDAVMAFWGAPLAHEEHPIYAINAALDMIDNLEAFKREYGYKEFDIGIGIHTGDAVVGMVGAQQRYDYTAIGDTVNLASRIEGLTKNCAQILVSETTMKVAKDHFKFIPRGEFQVKGRNESVKVYEPIRK